ncbi:MAG: PIN domain-containing protein [Nitrospinae bacterium]|nr:PIN domain-containing protein [Nitrospinota bacterium]
MRKIRAVIDTNVLVSGIISPKGAPRKILILARKGVFKVVSSGRSITRFSMSCIGIISTPNTISPKR